MKNLTLFLIFLSIRVSVFTQETVSISGFITDQRSGEPLIGAKVYDNRTKKGGLSNDYGFYSLNVDSDTVEIIVSYLGFERYQSTFFAHTNLTLSISLLPLLELKEVHVSHHKKIEEETQMSEIELSMQMVQTLPVLFGETDIIKTLQLFPGIQSGNEGSTGMYVRGGGADQNLILLDGVPIYNVAHLFGFFSVFNSDAINNVQMIKGGFPARYGGRLSSVLDIRMKEGNSKKLSGTGSIGLISSKLTLEGPIIKDKTSFLVSGRRTYIDLLGKAINSLDKNKTEDEKNTKTGYYFWDLNAKINHVFSEKSRLFISGYFGNDKFYNKLQNSHSIGAKDITEETDNRLRWGNAIAALRWNRVINPKIFMNVAATYSQYQFLVGFDMLTKTSEGSSKTQEEMGFNYHSGINDWTGKVDFNYYPNSAHSVKFGLGDTYHTFSPGVNQFMSKNTQASLDSVFGANQLYSHEYWIYAEDDWELSQRIKVNMGVHFSGFHSRNKWYPSFQPRISGRWLITENASIKASYSRMSQFLHLLTNPTIGLPTDLWVPVTDRVAPEHSNQYAIGYAQSLQKGWQLTLEAYYKDMKNLIEYKEGASFFSLSTDWQDKITTGKGNGYGLELLIEKKIGKTKGWIGYTLSWSNRQFEELNFGNVFPYTYDRRHDIGVAITHEFNDRIDVGVVWVYGSGNATTLALQTYNGIEGLTTNGSTHSFVEVEYLDGRNNYRAPSYHRLDISVNLHKQKKRYERTWSFGLYNAYSRQNPFFLFFDTKTDGSKTLKQMSLFPIIPSISYSFKF